MSPLRSVYLTHPDAPTLWVAIGEFVEERGHAFTTTRTELAKYCGFDTTRTVGEALEALQWAKWIIVSKLGQRTRIVLPHYARQLREQRREGGQSE